MTSKNSLGIELEGVVIGGLDLIMIEAAAAWAGLDLLDPFEDDL